MTEESRERIRYYVFAAAVGILLLLNATGVFKTVFGIDTAIFITLLAGFKTFQGSITALLEKRISADIALCIAVIAALAVGEYLAAAETMFIVLVGEGLESFAAGRTGAAIQRFIEQMPRRARVLRGGHEEDVTVESLEPGDMILVRAGERIAADGVIEEGFSTIDESSVTGEPLPREKQGGEAVFSGSLNGAGLLRIRVSHAGADTTLARVVKLVEEARQNRAPVERLADRVSKYFLPALLLAAGGTFYFTRDWLRTVSVLVVACPCALILATPTAMVAAIGGLARRGILVRGASVLQEGARIDTVIFDKTGTITEGRFEIVSILALDRSEDDLLSLAAAAERASSHPLAAVIAAEAQRRKLVPPPSTLARAVPGRGVECQIGGRTVLAGTAAFLSENGASGTAALVEEADRLGATAVLLSDNRQLAGALFLRDRLREGVREGAAGLEALGISGMRILTGDRRRAAEVMAREAGIADVEAGLLPEQKVERIAQLKSTGRTVAMVGDGINDAAALATAHVGIAVRGAADIAAEAAGVVYMPHSLEDLPLFFSVSRRAVATAWQNIIFFAGVVNFTAVICAATGVLGPPGAALTHQLSSLFVMMNSLRLLRIRRGNPWWHPFVMRGRAMLSRLRIGATLRSCGQQLYHRRAALGRLALRALPLLIVLNGFYIIRPDESGVVTRFDRNLPPAREPGLHYKLPWPIERLTRIQAHRVRVIEIGFRSAPGAPDTEPASYEWNAQHRSGRFQRKPEEALMLTGDQNMIEVSAVVHYDLVRPDHYLFRLLDGETTIRAAAEATVQSIVTTVPLDQIFTTGRLAIEQRAKQELQSRLDRYKAGIRVLGLRLQDVHPSLEAVDAFRDVSAAYEEKNRLINEAEGYRNEQIALARGNSKARVENANAYSVGRRNRAEGDASRFTQHENAYRGAPGPTETRLYLEAMEQVLPGKKKIIIDKTKSPRRLYLLEDGVEIGGPLPPARPATTAKPPEE